MKYYLQWTLASFLENKMAPSKNFKKLNSSANMFDNSDLLSFKTNPGKKSEPDAWEKSRVVLTEIKAFATATSLSEPRLGKIKPILLV